MSYFRFMLRRGGALFTNGRIIEGGTYLKFWPIRGGLIMKGRLFWRGTYSEGALILKRHLFWRGAYSEEGLVLKGLIGWGSLFLVLTQGFTVFRHIVLLQLPSPSLAVFGIVNYLTLFLSSLSFSLALFISNLSRASSVFAFSNSFCTWEEYHQNQMSSNKNNLEMQHHPKACYYTMQSKHYPTATLHFNPLLNW